MERGRCGLVLALTLLVVSMPAAQASATAWARSSVDAEAGTRLSLGIEGCAPGVGPVDTAVAYARCQGELALATATHLAANLHCTVTLSTTPIACGG